MHKYYLFLLLNMIVASAFAQESDPCGAYNMTVSVKHPFVSYDLSRNGTIEPPYVDSVNIENFDQETLTTYYDVQSGEEIDISWLERGKYILVVHFMGCVAKRMFIARGKTYSAVDENNIAPLDSTTNMFINNQGLLYFKAQDGNYYDLLGRRR